MKSIRIIDGRFAFDIQMPRGLSQNRFGGNIQKMLQCSPIFHSNEHEEKTRKKCDERIFKSCACVSVAHQRFC